MPRPYSNELRTRVIEAIESGASRREAAERYEISPSAVVIWAQCWKATGSVGSKRSGGSTSLLEDHAEFLLGLVVEQPDLTLDYLVATMCSKGSRVAAARYCGPSIGTTSASKSTLLARSKTAPRWLAAAGVGCGGRACLIRP